MIKMELKFDTSIPSFHLQKDLVVVAKTIIIPIIQENIRNQETLYETPLPPNNPKYTEWKRKKGLSDQILIATYKLYKSFTYTTRGNDTVEVSMDSERKDIGEFLQEKGLVFFGISTRMEKSAMNYMKKRIKEAISARK